MAEKVDKNEEERKKKLLDKLTLWLREAEKSIPHTTWLENAKEDYKFYAGKQDTDEVLAKLAEQKRPPTVYNQIKPKVDAIIGIGSDLRLSATVKAAETSDAAVSEIMLGAFTYEKTRMKLARVEQQCFAHTMKGGRALQRWSINDENPFELSIETERLESYQFYLDPNGRKYDLSDHRFVFVDKWIEEDTLKAFYPAVQAELIKQSAAGALPAADGGTVDAQGGTTANTDFPAFFNENNRKFRIVEGWYRDWKRVVWFRNPLNENRPEHLPESEFHKFNAILVEGTEHPKTGEFIQVAEGLNGIERVIPAIRFAMFTGLHLIEDGDNPYTGYNANHFPFTFYGGNIDDDTNHYFGAVTMMKDPQRGFNTVMRQLVHLLQTLPKGMPIFEQGAVLNEKEYKESSSDPTFFLKVVQGAIQNKRIDFQQQPNISPVYQALIEMFNVLMKDLSSVQDPLLAIQTTGREPGITAQMRQQSNIVALFNIFDNYRESRIHGANQLLSFVQQFLDVEKLAKILGPQFEGKIENFKEKLADVETVKYDLVVDEGMEGKTMRLAVAKVLSEFNQNAPGSIPVDVIMDYTDVPASIKERVSANQTANAEAQQDQADRDYMLELLKILTKLQADQDKTAAQIFTEMEKISSSERTAERSANNKSQEGEKK